MAFPSTNIFTHAVTRDDAEGISEEFAISGTNSLHRFSFSSVFHSIIEPASPAISSKFKGHLKFRPSNVNLRVDIHPDSSSDSPNQTCQSSAAEISCDITMLVCIRQDAKQQPSPGSTGNEEAAPASNNKEQNLNIDADPNVEMPPSPPSIPPSPAPPAQFHHPLGLIFSDDAVLHGFIAQHIQPNEAIREVAFYLLRAPWLISNEKEPPISADEVVVQKGLLPAGTYFSRFELFFDRNAKHRCHWMEGNERCTHEASRKNKAIGHAHSHFNYKPFQCVGDCGKPECQQRFTCSTVLKDHIGNRSRTQACEVCQRVVTAQNMKRHMKRHGER